MSDSDASNNINVAIRIRPLNENELKSSSEMPWEIESNCISLPGSTSFTFGMYNTFLLISLFIDKIFGMNLRDNEVLFCEIAKPIVDAALLGFNGTSRQLMFF